MKKTKHIWNFYEYKKTTPKNYKAKKKKLKKKTNICFFFFFSRNFPFPSWQIFQCERIVKFGARIEKSLNILKGKCTRIYTMRT